MADDTIWLIYGLGFATGLLFIIPVLYFIVKNRLRKDWTWAITRGKDGRIRIRETKPDGSHLHFKDGTYEIDNAYLSTLKKGLFQSPRSAWLYAQGDPRAIHLNQTRVPELDKDGKPTGNVTFITSPEPMFKPAKVWQNEIGTHIVSEALGRSKAELLAVIAVIMTFVVLVAVLALWAK